MGNINEEGGTPPTNNIGSGHIAGPDLKLGQTPIQKAKKKYKKKLQDRLP